VKCDCAIWRSDPRRVYIRERVVEDEAAKSRRLGPLSTGSKRWHSTKYRWKPIGNQCQRCGTIQLYLVEAK